MNEQNYLRLIWQMPVMILIATVLIPDVSWYSSTFGFWPIWILSMPLAAMLHHCLSHRKRIVNKQAVKQSQVLVFNQKRATNRKEIDRVRQAA